MIRKAIIIIMVLLRGNIGNLKSSFVEMVDLPSEFGEGALKTVNEFINCTHDLNHEIVVYFDYKTGEVIKKAEGMNDNVKIEYGKDEFKGRSMASIHNHTKDLLSPPSGKNFGILERDFEDYELIAAYNELWIFKAKGRYDELILGLRNYADLLYASLKSFCSRHYGGIKLPRLVEAVDFLDCFLGIH